eukprot:TRINITY_DN3177_c0_g1_i6.p1 TRINITY_DN3177_c0_g1~~TRINITY_DN3177_c0_g1_i6.p1  ORF type:complete len:165 (-),score=42.78 TRINITY_DN3177_c0_g1_i6:212-706(-)
MGQADEVEATPNTPILQNGPQQYQTQQQPVYAVQKSNTQTYAYPPQSGYPANYILPQNIVAQPQQYYVPPVASQIVYVQAPPQVYQGANEHQLVYALPDRSGQIQGPGYGLAISSFILFFISLFGFWVTTLPSTIFSLMLCSKKIIPKHRRPAVIACSIFELFA